VRGKEERGRSSSRRSEATTHMLLSKFFRTRFAPLLLLLIKSVN